MKLLTIGSDSKTVKGEKFGYLTGIIYLMPSLKLCPNSTQECRKACLVFSGRGKFNSVKKARLNRTKLWENNKGLFINQLIKEIRAAQKKADKLGLKLLIRLNGTSDIRWDLEYFEYNGMLGNIFNHFPSIQFYNYTKIKENANNYNFNHHITFSWSGENKNDCLYMLSKGINVAVPFNVKKGESLPSEFLGYKVIDGDLSDVRIGDPIGVIVGLRVKNNKNTKKESKFIVDTKKISLTTI